MSSSRRPTRKNPSREPGGASKPPTQVYQRAKKKGKTADLEAEVEREIEEALQAGTETEEEAHNQPPARKRKRDPPTTRNPSAKQLHKHLADVFKWAPMRFPDPDTLRQLGLYDDVLLILQNMGLESLMGMSYGVHEEVSRQFLSTLVVTTHCDEDEEEGFGRITFKVNGKNYKVGFRKIGTILGLSDDQCPSLPNRPSIADDVWLEIAGNVRIPAEIKNTDISNPAVRYAHKILNHTLYSRREPGGAYEEELKLLALSLLPIIEERLQRTTFEMFEGLGMVGLLMKRFCEYQDWAWTTADSTPKLYIGSLITPILEAMGVDMGPQNHGPAYLDLPYLKKSQFLSGRSGDLFAYPFWSRDEPQEPLQIFLPCTRLTTLSNPDHVAFSPASHELISADHGPLEGIKKPREKKTKKRASTAPRSSDADDEGPSSPVHPARLYGTERYYFKPYSGVTNNTALREALSQNAKLLRWNKMQDSTNYKLKNSVKILKRQMKKVTSMLNQLTTGSGCQRDDTQAGPSSLSPPVYYQPPPPRSPDSELRRQRRNRPPPTRYSSNESPSVATADDDTEGASSFT